MLVALTHPDVLCDCQIETKELYDIGTARRALGQRDGVWNEEANKKFLNKLDTDKDGAVSQEEFCEHFNRSLPHDPAGFEEAITQFTAAAMLVQERKKSGNLRARLEAKERSAAGSQREPSPPTRRMMEAKMSAEATIREAKEKAVARLAAENAKAGRRDLLSPISAEAQSVKTWRSQQLSGIYRLLVDAVGQEPIPVQCLLSLNKSPEKVSLLNAFDRFERGPAGGTVSRVEFTRHFDIMLPDERSQFTAVIDGFKAKVSSISEQQTSSPSESHQQAYPKLGAANPMPEAVAIASANDDVTAVLISTDNSSSSSLCLLLGSNQFRMLAICLFLAHFFCAGMVPMLPVFARGIGVSEFHFGCLAAMQPLAHALTYLHAQKVPPENRVSSSLLMLCAAATLLSIAETHVLAMYSARLLQGFGFSGFISVAVTIRVNMEPEVQQAATKILTTCFMLGGIIGAPICGLMHSMYGDHRTFGILAVLYAFLFVIHGLSSSSSNSQMQYESIPDTSLMQRNEPLSCNPRVIATIVVMLTVNATLGGFESTYAYFMQEVEDVQSVQVVGVAYGAVLFGIFFGAVLLKAMPSHELLAIAGMLGMALGMECAPMTAEVFVGHMDSQPMAAWVSHLGTMMVLGIGFRAANSAAMGALEQAPEGDCEQIETSPLYRLQQTWIVASIAVGAFVGPIVKHGLNFAATAHMGGLLLAITAIVTWFPLALTAKPSDDGQMESDEQL